MAWEPNGGDIVWLAQVISMLNEGGMVIYPSSGLIYKVSHKNKTLTLQNPSKLADPEWKQLHEMTGIVASFFYYTVTEATQ